MAEVAELTMAIPDRAYPYFPWSPKDVEGLDDRERKNLLKHLREVREQFRVEAEKPPGSR